MIRGIFHIARRDLLATIFSRTFLIWLLTPIIIGMIAILGALLSDGTVKLAGASNAIAILEADPAAVDDPASLIAAARARIKDIGFHPPRLVILRAQADPKAQARRLLGPRQSHPPMFGLVLYLGDATLRDVRIYAPGPVDQADMRMLHWLVIDARRLRLLGSTFLQREDLRPLPVELVVPPRGGTGATDEARAALATGIATVLFALIGLLAGTLLSNMVEEKASKVIELLVASVPIPAIFAGKLLGMLTISLFGIAVWSTMFGAAALLMPPPPIGLVLAPAVGWPALLGLGMTYLVTAYLLFGAIYLGIGSLCSSIREVQSLSLPVTIVQMVVIIGVLGAINDPDGSWATIMAWFPLSSPYMMAARAALLPGLAIHALAILWQLACAMLVIWAAARLFRRGVLHSGAPPSLFKLMRERS